jgi:hypothetical protein
MLAGRRLRNCKNKAGENIDKGMMTLANYINISFNKAFNKSMLFEILFS